MANRTTVQAVKRAAKILGSQGALARALSVRPSTVANWITDDKERGRPIPVAHCVAIENLTQHKVRREQLRPNDYAEIWPDLRAKEVHQ